MNPSDDNNVAPQPLEPVVPSDVATSDSTQASPNIDPHESSLGIGSPLALSRGGADDDECSPSHNNTIEPHNTTTTSGIGRRASPSITSATSAQSFASHSPAGSTRTNATTTVTGGRTRHRGAAVRYKSLEDAQASPVLTKANRSVTIDVKRSHDGSIIGAVGSMQGWRKTMEDRHVLAFTSEMASAVSRVPSSCSPHTTGRHRGGHHHHHTNKQSSPPASYLEPPQIQGVVRTLSSSDYQHVGDMCGSPPLQTRTDSRRSSDTTAPPPQRGATTSGNATRTSSEPVSPGAVSVTFSMGRVASGHPIHGARMLSESRRGSETESALVPRHGGGHDQYSNDRAMMGVFDGHRGPDAAAYASSILPRMLAPMLHGGDVLGTEGQPQSGSPSRRQSDQTFRRESTQSERTILSSENGSRYGSPTASAGAANKLAASFSAHSEEVQTKRKTEVSDFITRAFQETDDLLRTEHMAYKEGSMDNRSIAGTQSSAVGGASFTSNGGFGSDNINTPAAAASSLLTIGGLGAYLQTHAPLSNASFDYNGGGLMSENASFVSAWAGPSTYNNNNNADGGATPRDMDGPPLTEAAPVVDHLGRFIHKPNADPGMQGATAHVVVVTDNNYMFCNLGDSRGYLCRRRVQRDLSPDDFARSWSVAQQQRHHQSRRSSPSHIRGRVSSATIPDESPVLLSGGFEIPVDVDGGVDTPPIATSSPRMTGGGGQFTLRKTTDAPGGLAIPHVQSYQGSPNLDRSRASNSPRYGFSGAEEGDPSDGSPRITAPSEEPQPALFTAVHRAPSSSASPNHHHSGGVGIGGGECSTSVAGSVFDDDRHEEESRGDDEIDASGDLDESTTDIYGDYTIEAIPMSTDHRTLQNEAEKQRVLDAGGFVVNNRVNGKLSVTRAFGDFDLKPNMNPSHSSRMAKVEASAGAAASTSCATSMSSPLAIVSSESTDASTSAPLTPPQAMPPLAPRPVATSTTTTKNAPPANPVSNTPDIAIVDRLGSTTSSSIGGVGSPMRTADGSLTSTAAEATPDPNNSPTSTALDIHSPYPFAAYDILLVGCDGVWELQTAEVIGKRAVDAIEAVLQPIRNAILQGRQYYPTATTATTNGNDCPVECPTVPTLLPPMCPTAHRGSTSTSGVVSPRKGSAQHTLSSTDARRFHTPISVGGLTADGKFIRTHSSHTVNEEVSRRMSSHITAQRGGGGGSQCSPNHSLTHTDDPIPFTNEAMSSSLSPRTMTVGEAGDISPIQLLTEKLESTLRDVVVTSLNAACSVHCDPKGTTPGCDNLSLGIMLVAA